MSSKCWTCGDITDFNGSWTCRCDSKEARKKDRQRLNEEARGFAAPDREFAAAVLRKLAKSGKPVPSARLLREAEKLAPTPVLPVVQTPESDRTNYERDKLLESIRGMRDRSIP